MSLLRKTFDRMVEHEYRWASALFRLVFWWTAAFFALLAALYLFYRMKTLVASIPTVIQAACLILIALAIILMAAMLRERRRALDACDRFLTALDELKPATERERRNGISPEKMAAIRRRTGALTGRPREWWNALDESLQLYTGPMGEEGWFVTRPPAESISEDDVIDSFYNAGFYQAVPGILTALGLLATFIAILQALAGVTYNAQDPVRPVSGIDQLINGLSGKFLSSIVALILSVLFTLLERKVCDRQLINAYSELTRRCKALFPLLTESRILLDIQRATVSRRTRFAAAAGDSD